MLEEPHTPQVHPAQNTSTALQPSVPPSPPPTHTPRTRATTKLHMYAPIHTCVTTPICCASGDQHSRGGRTPTCSRAVQAQRHGGNITVRSQMDSQLRPRRFQGYVHAWECEGGTLDQQGAYASRPAEGITDRIKSSAQGSSPALEAMGRCNTLPEHKLSQTLAGLRRLIAPLMSTQWSPMMHKG